MNELQDDDERETPNTQPEPARGGAGGGKTAVGAGNSGSDDENSPIALAQREARRLGQNFIGTEFMLLGLIGCKSGIASQALSATGATLDKARIEVEAIIGRGSGFVAVEISFSPRAKRALQLPWDEARQLGHNYIGSEHVLLGIIREQDSVAARGLENLGVEPASVRQNVLALLRK